MTTPLTLHAHLHLLLVAVQVRRFTIFSRRIKLRSKVLQLLRKMKKQSTINSNSSSTARDYYHATTAGGQVIQTKISVDSNSIRRVIHYWPHCWQATRIITMFSRSGAQAVGRYYSTALSILPERETCVKKRERRHGEGRQEWIRWSHWAPFECRFRESHLHSSRRPKTTMPASEASVWRTPSQRHNNVKSLQSIMSGSQWRTEFQEPSTGFLLEMENH